MFALFSVFLEQLDNSFHRKINFTLVFFDEFIKEFLESLFNVVDSVGLFDFVYFINQLYASGTVYLSLILYFGEINVMYLSLLEMVNVISHQVQLELMNLFKLLWGLYVHLVVFLVTRVTYGSTLVGSHHQRLVGNTCLLLELSQILF